MKHLYYPASQTYKLSTYEVIGCCKATVASPALLYTQTAQREYQSMMVAQQPVMATRIYFIISLASNGLAHDLLQPRLLWHAA